MPSCPRCFNLPHRRDIPRCRECGRPASEDSVGPDVACPAPQYLKHIERAVRRTVTCANITCRKRFISSSRRKQWCAECKQAMEEHAASD